LRPLLVIAIRPTELVNADLPQEYVLIRDLLRFKPFMCEELGVSHITIVGGEFVREKKKDQGRQDSKKNGGKAHRQKGRFFRHFPREITERRTSPYDNEAHVTRNTRSYSGKFLTNSFVLFDILRLHIYPRAISLSELWEYGADFKSVKGCGETLHL